MMNYRTFFILVFSLFCARQVSGQQLMNEKLFSRFLHKTDTSLIILGENHSSSVASTIYPELIRKLNERNDLNCLIIEFGPSEAYFYTKYLSTGDEKYLKYTIYAGYYTDWLSAWREIYKMNQSLSEPLQIAGIDFDRARTFAYALYNIFKGYPERPVYIDSLMNFIRKDSFYTTYTNGYPTASDLQFTAKTRELLKMHISELYSLLNKDDQNFLKQMIENNCTGFNELREMELYRNTLKVIKNSDEKEFLLLIGRDHAYLKAIYDDKPRLASLIRESGKIPVLTGLVLHEKSQQWGENYTEPITLYEVRDKIPWKEYNEHIQKKAKYDLSVVPLKGKLKSLASYTDYLIIARNQEPIAF